ncbi:MAG: tRNA 2-selenouridine(34) synthase MnmH [Pseudomonadales bacterium]
MTAVPPDTDLDVLFVDDTPLLDVRAPIEFNEGAFPAAVNLPILSDQERHDVGITYAQHGQAAATSLGHELISGQTREDRIETWTNFIKAAPHTHLYCFRGGQRSQIACDWLAAAGYNVPRITGGYKRLRNHLLDVFKRLPPLLVVSGQTGTGKTLLLEHFSNSVDLEGLANHRGSAFGGKVSAQPTQVNFENALAIAFLKQGSDTDVMVEDESRLIGRINVPPLLQEQMKASPIMLLIDSLENRVERIYDEYIELQWREYQAAYQDDPRTAFENYLLNAIDAIRKRLGGVAHEALRASMTEANAAHAAGKGLDGHRNWIRHLLTEYYDPMYNYQLEKKTGRIRVQGTAAELIEWYREQPSLAEKR